MKDCTKEDYMDTEFERIYGKLTFDINQEKKLCIDDPKNEIHLQGNKDSMFFR